MEKVRILIVDDTLDILRMIELILQQKYEVLSATDGLTGITKAMKYLPDLIVLDIMMPKMSGYQFCDQLKKNNQLKDIPIIFISAKGTPVEQEYGLKKGAAAYLPKPFDPKDLMIIVDDLLVKNPPQSKKRPSYEQILMEESRQKKVSWRG